MPRKINYPGYQIGGSTSNFDANDDRVRYYDEKGKKMSIIITKTKFKEY